MFKVVEKVDNRAILRKILKVKKWFGSFGGRLDTFRLGSQGEVKKSDAARRIRQRGLCLRRSAQLGIMKVHKGFTEVKSRSDCNMDK